MQCKLDVPDQALLLRCMQAIEYVVGGDQERMEQLTALLERMAGSEDVNATLSDLALEDVEPGNLPRSLGL